MATSGSNGGYVGISHVPTKEDLITSFTSPGTFNRSVPQGDVLVVAGGAGTWEDASGGGAGGVRFTPAHPLPASAVSVTVGAGGTGVPSNPFAPGSGGGSEFTTSPAIQSSGGGSGTNDSGYPGVPGGSGGGATYGPSGASVIFGEGTSGEGNDGGQGYRLAPQYGNRGGGGGKAAAGGNAPSGPDPSPGGVGGAGTDYSPTYGTQYGDSGYFGGGGAGASSRGDTSASGGVGGGGDSITPSQGQWPLVVGAPGTGGGGGNSPGYSSGPAPDGGVTGGSGAVLVKEANVLQNSGGVWSMQAVFKSVAAGNWSN